MKLLSISFGCQMSLADGAELARPLLARGFRAAEGLEDADALILNTCTVRQHAEDRALSQLGRLKPWKEARPERFLIVAGCAAERLGGWLTERFPYVDLVVGAKSIEQYPEVLERALAERFDWARENAGAWGETVPAATGAGAYVTVMRGCNYSCSYCIVPAVRGRELYRPLDVVLAEVRARAAEGAREVTLLGQTVNSWRDGRGRDFADLLRAVDASGSVERVRFTSPHPFFLGERVMAAMAECRTVAPHLHLPAQSGSDRLLKLMRRNYTSADFLQKAARLRALIPDLALTSDFIVGFPGETATDFQATLDLAAAADLDSAYCFAFSPRAGTEAAAFGDTVPEEAKQARLRVLLDAVEANMARKLDALLGRTVRVLLETETDGRTQYHFRARLDAPAAAGTFVDAVVTGRTDTALKARALRASACVRGNI